MGDLSENFSRREFACRGTESGGGHPGSWCGFDTVDAELIIILEDLRQHFGSKPIYIISGHRCPVHNKHEEGKDGSYHLIGRGVDFRVGYTHADKVGNYLHEKYPDKYGIGRYIGRTHVDSRDQKARWDMR